MLETIHNLEVSQSQTLQLDLAQSVHRDFNDQNSQSLKRCDLDQAYIDLAHPVTTSRLSFADDAIWAIDRFRTSLASAPSIHGNKQPTVWILWSHSH